MKIVYSVLLIGLLALSLNAAERCKCGYYIDDKADDLKKDIRSYYNDVFDAIDKTEEQYRLQLAELRKLNKQLKIKLALLKNSLKEDREIVFLLKKFNMQQANQNSIDAVKDAQ